MIFEKKKLKPIPQLLINLKKTYALKFRLFKKYTNFEKNHETTKKIFKCSGFTLQVPWGV